MQKITSLKFKAIFSGVAADTLGTLIAATVLFASMAAAGISEAEIALRIRGTSGLTLMLIIGLCFTLLGGYVAGRAAGQSEIVHGAVVAGIGLALGLFFREPGLPLWYEAVSLAAMIPVGMAGGSLAREGNVKRKLTGKQ